MAPSLRKRVWYQRFIGRDEFSQCPSLFRKRICSDLLNERNNKDISCSNSSSKRWRHRPIQRGNGDLQINSSTRFSDDDLGKMTPDVQKLEEKHVVPFVDVAGKGNGRMLMRDWLEAIADDGCMSGLKWLNKALGLVQISWKHGSRAGWNRSDVEVFESWALHTGKFNPNKSDCKRWKANFRCALNSLPDVIEIKERGDTRSSNPYKVYRLLPTHGTSEHLRTKRMKSAKKIRSKLIPKPEKLDIQIKLEPIDPDDTSIAPDKDNGSNDKILSSSSLTDEIKICNGEQHSLRKDYINDHRTLRIPVDFTESFQTTKRQRDNDADSRWFGDHSYACISKHLTEQESSSSELESVDGHDLISTINEELEKFCAGNIYMDLWSEEMLIGKGEFSLCEFSDLSYSE